MSTASLARRASLALLLSLGVSAAACAAPPEEDDPQTLSDALSQQDWDTAVRYLAGLRYLPWTYYEDGCYARALYYSMNLASEGVPSNHVYIVAQPGFGLGSTGRWRYHVAPMVTKDSDPSRLYVLDPVYDRSQALALDAWAGRQTRVAPGQEGYPSLFVLPGTSYGTPGYGLKVPDAARPVAAEFKEPTWADMPDFDIRKISRACDVMHSYIDKEKTTNDAQKRDKHLTLARETRRLVAVLAQRDKLEGRAADLAPTCTSYDPSLAACPVDDGRTNPGSKECCLASAHYCWSDANGACSAPGTVLGGRTCGAGGNWHSGGTSGGGSTGGGAACPADAPATNPGSKACCLASSYWCWSDTGQFCAAPGTQRNGYVCGAGGNWTR